MNPLQMAHQIRLERKKYEAEETTHNQELHKQILATWRRDSPKMTAELERLKVLDDAAFVSQIRMWRQMDEYLKGGMPVTDAREQAEQEHLLLTPEEPEQDDSDLPPELQDGPQHLKDRWREQMTQLNERP